MTSKKSNKQMQPVEVKATILPEDRWEQGVDHDERTYSIYRFLQEYDHKFNDSELDLKSGGDGDNGETLMYLLDEYFAAVDTTEEPTNTLDTKSETASESDREESEDSENKEELEDSEGLSRFLTQDTRKASLKALELISSYAQIEGSHHRIWTIDQVTRELTGDNYQDFVDGYCFEEVEGLDLNDAEAVAKARKIASGDYDWEDEEEFSDEEIQRVEKSYYEWDTGIAP